MISSYQFFLGMYYMQCSSDVAPLAPMSSFGFSVSFNDGSWLGFLDGLAPISSWICSAFPWLHIII